MDQPEMFPEPVSGVLVHAMHEPGRGWYLVVRSVHGHSRVQREAAYSGLTLDEMSDVLCVSLLDLARTV